MVFGFLPRRFAMGDYIFNEDDDVEEFYLILQGEINAGFTIQGLKYCVDVIGPTSVIGDYYAIRNQKSEFFFEAKTIVESIGITRSHFMDVLNRHPKKREGMEDRINKNYKEFKEVMAKEREYKLKNYSNYSDYYEVRIIDKGKDADNLRLIDEDKAKLEANKEINDKIIALIKDIDQFMKKVVNGKEKYVGKLNDMAKSNEFI